MGRSSVILRRCDAFGTSASEVSGSPAVTSGVAFSRSESFPVVSVHGGLIGLGGLVPPVKNKRHMARGDSGIFPEFLYPIPRCAC